MKLPFHGGVCAASEVALGAVQRERIEARDDDLPFGADHAIRLAQHEVRIVGELERVRQHDQVDRVLRERQPVRIGDDVAPAGRSRASSATECGFARGTGTRAARSAARGSRRCRRPSGRSTPARARAGSCPSGVANQSASDVDTLAAGPEDASMVGDYPHPRIRGQLRGRLACEGDEVTVAG